MASKGTQLELKYNLILVKLVLNIGKTYELRDSAKKKEKKNFIDVNVVTLERW